MITKCYSVKKGHEIFNYLLKIKEDINNKEYYNEVLQKLNIISLQFAFIYEDISYIKIISLDKPNITKCRMMNFEHYMFNIVENNLEIFNVSIENVESIICKEKQRIKEELLEGVRTLNPIIKENLFSLRIVEDELDEFHTNDIYIKKTNANTNTYGIYRGTCCFSKKNRHFYLEPASSSRDEEFFKEFRFSSLEDAIKCFFL